jgi:tetratricopeptide (TPR) repeat protein
VSRGRLEGRLKRGDRARACFRRALEAEPESYYAWHCWAMLEADARNLREARVLFQRALAANPRNAATYQSWGVLEAKHGDLANATALFAQGHKVQPKNTHILAAWAGAEHRRGNGQLAVELFEKAIEARPSDAGAYQQYAVVSKELGDIEGARRLFALGAKANKQHLRTYQEWGLMEAQVGSLALARAVFQEGVWAAPRGKGVASLWQAWALAEADAGLACLPPPLDQLNAVANTVDFSKPRPWTGLGADRGGSGTLPAPAALQTARKYFQYAVSASQQAYPTATVVAWAKTEERFGQVSQARALFEEAVVKDGANKRLWAAYESFEGRAGDFTDVKRISQRAAVALLRGAGKSVDDVVEASNGPPRLDKGGAGKQWAPKDQRGKSQ